MQQKSNGLRGEKIVYAIERKIETPMAMRKITNRNCKSRHTICTQRTDHLSRWRCTIYKKSFNADQRSMYVDHIQHSTRSVFSSSDRRRLFDKIIISFQRSLFRLMSTDHPPARPPEPFLFHGKAERQAGRQAGLRLAVLRHPRSVNTASTPPARCASRAPCRRPPGARACAPAFRWQRSTAPECDRTMSRHDTSSCLPCPLMPAMFKANRWQDHRRDRARPPTLNTDDRRCTDAKNRYDSKNSKKIGKRYLDFRKR